MAFDAYNSYLEAQRRQRRWERIVPIFVVAVILAIMAIGFHGAYVRAHAKPKPAATEPQIIPYTKLAAGLGTGGVCVYRQGEGWICDDPALSHPKLSHAFQVTPRKHKRRVDGHLVWYDFKFTPSPNQPYESWRFINTIPAELSCTRRTKTSGIHCESRPLTPAEIENYKPQPSDEGVMNADDHIIIEPNVQRTKIVPDCLYGGSVDGSIRPCTAHDNFTIHLNPDRPIPSWIPAPSTPSCVMPADIDVCPVQMLEPKAANDSSSSLTVAAALMTCVIQPDATPIINLKSGPTPVPCATLKWATDAVDADKKKGISRTFDTLDWNYEWHSHD